MGYEDRDYMQNERGGGGSSIMPGYPVCRFLIIATVVCFLLQIFVTRNSTTADFEKSQKQVARELGLENTSAVKQGMTEEEILLRLQHHSWDGMQKISVVEEWFELDSAKVLKGQVWRLLTSTFLHNRFGVWHIAFNLLFLYWFGRELEDLFGHREFLAFYLTAAVVSSVAFVGLQLILGEQIPAIGASGAVMAVACVYAIYHPTETINVMFVFPIQIRFLLLIYVIYDLHPVLMKLSGVPMYTGTAHAAHLGGLLFGYLYYRYGWTLEPVVNVVASAVGSLKRETREPDSPTESPVTATKPDPHSKRLEANLDSVLQKISAEGEESLTPRERKILQEASKHYKKSK